MSPEAASNDASPETATAAAVAIVQTPTVTQIEIRPEQPDDHDRIRTVVARAFESDVEADLVDRIRASPQYEPTLSLVGVEDGLIVGHVMVSGATLHAEDGDHAILMLSPLAVEPDCQRRGVGAALVWAAVDRLVDRGAPFVVLEGAPAYYGRFGFVAAANYGITMPLPDWAPVEAAQLLPLPAFDLSAVHGGGAVVYPIAFDGVD